jgi:hypothetical protein
VGVFVLLMRHTERSWGWSCSEEGPINSCTPTPVQAAVAVLCVPGAGSRDPPPPTHGVGSPARMFVWLQTAKRWL